MVDYFAIVKSNILTQIMLDQLLVLRFICRNLFIDCVIRLRNDKVRWVFLGITYFWARSRLRSR